MAPLTLLPIVAAIVCPCASSSPDTCPDQVDEVTLLQGTLHTRIGGGGGGGTADTKPWCSGSLADIFEPGMVQWQAESPSNANTPTYSVSGTVLSFHPCSGNCRGAVPVVTADIILPCRVEAIWGTYVQRSTGNNLADDCNGGSVHDHWNPTISNHDGYVMFGTPDQVIVGGCAYGVNFGTKTTSVPRTVLAVATDTLRFAGAQSVEQEHFEIDLSGLQVATTTTTEAVDELRQRHENFNSQMEDYHAAAQEAHAAHAANADSINDLHEHVNDLNTALGHLHDAGAEAVEEAHAERHSLHEEHDERIDALEERIEALEDQAQAEAYRSVSNYCVGPNHENRAETARGNSVTSLAGCQAMCDADTTCFAVEWYQLGWNGRSCFHMLGQVVSGGSPSQQWRDAVCYIKA